MFKTVLTDRNMKGVEYMITQVIYVDKDGQKKSVEYRARVMGSQGYWKVKDFSNRIEAEYWCQCNQDNAGMIPRA